MLTPLCHSDQSEPLVQPHVHTLALFMLFVSVDIAIFIDFLQMNEPMASSTFIYHDTRYQLLMGKSHCILE
jgi:hypothetical protein